MFEDKSDNKILICGHRGAAGLTPENTIPGYRAALNVGVDVVDIDVTLSKDGVVVVYHDLSLNPAYTRDAKGEWLKKTGPVIKSLTFEQLQDYDVGRLNPNYFYQEHFPLQHGFDKIRIPSLEQVIQFVKSHDTGHIEFQIEIKTDPTLPDASASPEAITEAVIDIVRQEGVADRTHVHSFDWKNILILIKEAPEITPSFVTERNERFNSIDERKWTANLDIRDYDNSIPKMIHHMGGQFWCPYFFELTEDQINEAYGYGLKVLPWTVDNPLVMQRMIKLNIAGIITNRPDLLRGILAAKGHPLPPPIPTSKSDV